ncbi:DUF350 domain-containing protein [Azospirillum sp. RWY-5-1]|uniref:DUF350 domain-containing protein n=1 Tax=Azospirillum oleiclasticum TaxID=2735135 RepID=A0ABX2T817_9PROT|nr:DUF350 domain-containing protein [Azospirillum oleiclasticum]NYZ11924.1 DUF350 domain-containing protein [Azospirillum oleiclasticum]NYZ19084.1 DUF350 domain-containing protein [Azospirillum oleiclasticum]
MLETLPLYLGYVATSVALLVLFTAIYTVITPYHELTLIRAGNKAAAFSLGGVVIGFALVLASTAAHSVNLLDLALWGAVAMVCQIAVFFGVAMLLKGFRAGIEAGNEAFGLALAAMSVAVGLINAGAVTY